MKSIITIITIVLISNATVFAQDNSEKIVDVAYDACDCIGKIETNLSKVQKSEEIKACITSANMAWQINKSMVAVSDKVNESLVKTDTLTITSDKLNIVISDADYQEIESYLLDTCGDMETIYFTEDEASENSYSNKEKATEYYNKGLIAYDNQEFKKAVSFYKKAIKEDKNFAFAWDNLGRTYKELGDFKEAIKCYKKSLKIDPKGGMPLMNIAVTYGYLEQFDKAKKAYRQYGKVFKNDPETYYGLGRIYALDNDFENALDNMMKAYVLYIEMQSPYKKDAEKFIAILYQELENQGKQDVFNTIAKKYNIQITDN